MAMRFSVGNNTAGKPSWWLYGSNGEMVAWAGETFSTSFHANQSAVAFKSGAAAARYETYVDAGGKWRWRAWRSSDKVAASGESFDGEWNANRAAENVRVNAGTAIGP